MGRLAVTDTQTTTGSGTPLTVHGGDGSTDPEDHPQAHSWGGSFDPRTQGTVYDNKGDVFPPPAVPGGGGGGKPTSVDTPSMLLYASNLERVLPALDTAKQALESVLVAPGGLPAARKMRVKVNGTVTDVKDDDSALRGNYQSALTDIKEGATALIAAMRDMAKKYARLEDANKMAATDLQKYLQEATADFDQLSQHLGGGSGGGSGSGGGKS
ncbi:hypothetical protein SHL15_8379 [Streptomyces hygroscopicus subsp. limoneus]|nr:hypothetical protein SHL15_8379 [Streptomyces hygroscopicus subsp. limoneus]